MSMEAALLESRTLRATMCTRVDVLDEVKALVLLPNGIHANVPMVAEYFGVGEKAVHSVVQRHRTELTANGFVVLKPVDNSDLQVFNLKTTQIRGRGLALFPRRAILNVAMLLRDSEVARQVRSRLLDTVEAAWRRPEPEVRSQPSQGRPWKSWNELRWDEYETVSRDPATGVWQRRIDGLEPFDEPFDEPTGAGVEERLAAVERRQDSAERVVASLGERVGRQEDALRAARREVLAARQDLAHLRRPRKR